ncbi:MAG: hypothetical protein IPO27_14840 [Bacteroidetes bacterium]|nr:hypothetical protein [Bacteroidota bacterium]
MRKKTEITKKEIGDWIDNSSAEEVNAVENILVDFASTYAEKVPEDSGKKILANLETLIAMQQNYVKPKAGQYPWLTSDANLLVWEELVKEIKPPTDFDNIHLHKLLSDDKRDLFVAWVKQEVPEEVHHDLNESFIILEGSCNCNITDTIGVSRKVHMREGDYIAFGLGENHDILITTTKPVKAILQWAKV